MAIRDLLPWRRSEPKVPAKQETGDPFTGIQYEMNRMVDDFFNLGFGESSGDFSPKIDIIEDKANLVVSAELPGMDEKDIAISLADNILTLRGEKHSNVEEKGKHSYRIERSYGSFRRDIRLPGKVDTDKIDASFKHGVLTIVMPKSAETDNGKRIKVRAE